VVAQIGIWGRKHTPVTKDSAADAAALEKGGPALWKKLQAELRRAHAEGRAA